MGNESLWLYFINASPIVRLVMLILVTASILSWTIIFQRSFLIKKTKQAISAFEDLFWSGTDLGKLYTELNDQPGEATALESIFVAGFREFLRLRKQANSQPAIVLEGVQRAMRIARSKEMSKLEQNLSFLATVASTSPYLGIFGTVIGIMSVFHALGNVQQVTLSAVAPGISEALIATAIGLFATIPAVIAYNRFANETNRIFNHYDTFQEEFSNILYRQAHTSS